MSGNDRFFQQNASMNVDHDEQDSGDEEVGAGAVPSTPPSSPPLVLSPSSRPPIRVPSSNSLFGEYIMSSIRRSSEDDEQTTTPPSYANTPMTLSPPPLTQETPPLFQTGEESVHSNPLSVKWRGRPPLAPHPQFSLAQARQTSNATSANSNQHTRDKSTGDYSFLSALTDPSDSDGEFPTRTADKVPHHRSRHRSVSWDQTWEVNRTQAPDILQPILLDDDNPLRQPVPEVLQQVAPPLVVAASQPAPTVRINPLDTINMAEFVSPMESEAETAILRALEDHQREYTPAREMLFPNVPDDAAHSFEEMSASVDGDEPLSIEGTDEGEQADQMKSTYSRGLSRRETASVHSLTTPKPGSVGTKPPVSPSRSKKSELESKAKPGHRRVNTIATRNEQAGLESTLFDLTAAMREIHSAEQVCLPSANDSHLNRRLLMSQDGGSAGPVFSQEGPIDSQETFVHHANLLFHQHLNGNIQSQQQEPLLPLDDTTIPDARPGDDASPKRQNLFFPAKGTHDDNHDVDLSAQGLEIDIETGSTEETTPVASNKKVYPLRADGLKRPIKPAHCLSNAVKSVPINAKRAIVSMQQEYEIFKIFLKPRMKTIKLYARVFALFIFLPTMAISMLLFHGLRNPQMSVGCGDEAKILCPSISWFLNFLILRQFIAYTLARATEIVLIDFMALKTRAFLRLLGPIATLMFVQSKGWPFQLSCWAFYSLVLNSGVHRFAKHWLFYQHAFRMFNEENPAGDIPNGWWNYRILEMALVLGISVGIKRFLVGLYLGRRMYAIYGSHLAKVIHQMIVVSQVAALGREFEMKMQDPNLAAMTSRSLKTLGHPLDWDWGRFGKSVLDEDDEHTDEEQQNSKRPHHQRVLSNVTGTIKSAASPNIADKRNQINGMLKGSERIKMMELLEAWEEPEREAGQPGKISISAILQFRQSLAFMDQSFPFALAFGLADTREHCIESSQGVYRRLLLEDPVHIKATLEFSTIAVLARADDDHEDSIDPTKMKDLIRIFRPDREGKLSMLDFVKSVDAVYKSLRLLRAAINNSSQIGRATELMINTVFYFFTFCGILAAFKVNPLTFFLSLSSVIIAFAFMIGSASAKYFEGILFILVRQPYDIGDRIAISDPNTDTAIDGSHTWFIEKVDLYTTTARNAQTNEVATLANGSLATSRIINAARSPNAIVYLKLKFGLDVPYAKVQLFRKTVETFVKARPREWLTMIAFWASRVESDLGFIEYVIICKHRERWQDLVPIRESKADLFSYCLEVQKQLGMRYIAPHLPVDLRMAQLDQRGYLGQRPASVGENQPIPADDGLGEQPGPPRHRVDTSTMPDGVHALADLFMIRRGN